MARQSAAGDLDVPRGALQDGKLVPLGGGEALVGLTVDRPSRDGYSCSRITPERAVVARFVAGRVANAQQLTESLDGLAAGGGRSATVTSRAVGVTGNCSERSRLAMSAGRADQPTAEMRTVANRVELMGTSLAVDETGVAALAWSELLPHRDRRGLMKERLWLTLWPAGETVQRPRLLAEGPSEGYVGGNAFEGLIIRPRPGGGWMVVTRRQPGRRPALVLDEVLPDGTQRRESLGRADDLTDISVATSPSGRVAVLWAVQDGGEERNEPYRVRAAVREAGAARFSRARLLDAGGRPLDEPAGSPVVGIDRRGTAIAAWPNRNDRGTYRVAVARASRGAGFAARRTVATRHGLLGFAVEPGGRSTLLLSHRDAVTALVAPGRRTVPVSPTGLPATALDVSYLPGEPDAAALLVIDEQRRWIARLVRVR